MKLNSMTLFDFVSLELTPRGKIIEPFLPEEGWRRSMQEQALEKPHLP